MSKADRPKSVPVAPDAVRVWRGYRNDNLTHEQFLDKLGTIFIPGTVQIQKPVGLAAYLPTVLPVEKHAAVPDEIALVFYEYQAAYDEAKLTVGGRAYSYMHDLVFSKGSHSGFPVRYAGELVPDRRYHLFDDHVDWQRGQANVFVGVRAGGSAQDFLDRVGRWLRGVQELPRRPEGAIAVASTNHVVYWEHWPDAAAAEASPIPGLAEIVEPAYQEVIRSTPWNLDLWESTPGLRVAGGESFNFEFERRKERR